MNKELELAKSWFVAAQLLIIFAGFMFATSGMAYSNANNIISRMVSNLTQTSFNVEDPNNIGKDIYDVLKISQEILRKQADSNLELSTFTLEIGGVITFLSLFCFGMGRYKIRKIKELNPTGLSSKQTSYLKRKFEEKGIF